MLDIVHQSFRRYPSLQSIFWPRASSLPLAHPLLNLVLNEDEQPTVVAKRTDECAARVYRHDPCWLSTKVDIVLEDGEYQQIVTVLGERRAYGELLSVWGGSVSGHEQTNRFDVRFGEHRIRVMVHTPQPEKHRIRTETKYADYPRTSTLISELLSFGWPDQDRPNIEWQSRCSGGHIMQAEDHFQDSAYNVLWLDFEDPGLWPRGIELHEVIPLSSCRGAVTSGAVWSALYGQKDLPVYQELSCHGLPQWERYVMPAHGRFTEGTKIDFVVVDLKDHHIVFQNHTKARSYPDELYQSLHQLDKFNLGASWIDWPAPGALPWRVSQSIETILGYTKMLT